MLAFEVVFWVAVGLIAYTHVGYPLLLRRLVAVRGAPRSAVARPEDTGLPTVSLIVAARDEGQVIERWVADALALDYPRERLEVIVVSDGSSDATVERAERAGADLVLDLPPGGKVVALNAGVERAQGEVLAFSDANSSWDADALWRLAVRLAEPEVGYVCGSVRFEAPSGDNQEGVYWRYEMGIREHESRLAGITAGNGAINAIRRDDYILLPPGRGQDICFPFMIVKAGMRPVYEPTAQASEPMAATIDDERARKRRMMTGAWATMLGGGMLSPRGYGPLYWLEIVSHRLLRYATPILHAVALAANVVLLGEGAVYTVTLALQGAVLAAAALARLIPARPLQLARYYVAVTWSSAAGLWDYVVRGVPVIWDKAPGTR